MLLAISRHFRATATAVALISAPFASAVGQATAPVDPADPVYRVIAWLAAERLIDTIIVGQRPYSRRAVAHMLNEAERNRSNPYFVNGNDRTNALVRVGFEYRP